jgi:hypothetical protein
MTLWFVPKHFITQFSTFNNVTRSAACSRVNSEMSSTILEIFGSEGAAGGGGGVWCDVGSVAVARHRKGGETLERLNEKCWILWSVLLEHKPRKGCCTGAREGTKGTGAAALLNAMNKQDFGPDIALTAININLN